MPLRSTRWPTCLSPALRLLWLRPPPPSAPPPAAASVQPTSPPADNSYKSRTANGLQEPPWGSGALAQAGSLGRAVGAQHQHLTPQGQTCRLSGWRNQEDRLARRAGDRQPDFKVLGLALSLLKSCDDGRNTCPWNMYWVGQKVVSPYEIVLVVLSCL